MRRGHLLLAGSASLLTLLAAAPAAAQTAELPELVITATSRPEPVSQIAGTVQVIKREQIEKSTGRSVTDLLAENAVGFMSEWTAGQTSLNIRGASTEGQGRDFKSQVLVLINGHRAGTANISKLSLSDVERIEIVRGPSSVVYGSQNMGGVVNIIMKTGRTAPGGFAEGSVGSWAGRQGKAQVGGVFQAFDWYFGVTGAGRDDYDAGGGRKELNTSYKRFGATGSFGAQFNDYHRLEMNIRTDGIYDEGFRGSSSNLFAFDTRTNQSVDLSYRGRTEDDRFNWFLQGYAVHDVDNLNNPTPLSALNAVTSRTTVDHNIRKLDIVGTRFQPRAKLWEGNELLTGYDFETSRIRSDRYRQGGSAVTQTSPQDNNQTEYVNAFYAEDSQKLFNDRLTIRGGVRRTYGTTHLDATPFAPTLIPGSKDYQATTYSAGSTLKVTDWLAARVGASSGFRAPTATELGANFTITPIGTTIFGNPALKPETSQQVEAGLTAAFGAMRFDTAIFQNVISDRITSATVSSKGGVVIQQQINNPADIVVRGLELQANMDVFKAVSFNADRWRWSVFSNGYYNFDMVDKGAVPAAGSTRATRINKYELGVGTKFGQQGTGQPFTDWNLQLQGILRGPMWYNTEESLNPVYFPGQARNTTVYKKNGFWVFNVRGEVEVMKGVTLFGAVRNLFDRNQHPIFIGLDQTPCLLSQANQNGACGNSIPGREFIVGLQGRF